MIKVAYLIDTIISDSAGTEKQLLEIIRRIDRTSFDVCLICLWESDWMRNNELPCPCLVLGYQGFFSLSFLTVIRRLVGLIAEKQIQIIQTFFEDSIFVAWTGSFFTKQQIVLLSSRRDMGLGNQNQPWYHKIYTLLLPFVNKRFAGIIANSKEVRKYAARREKTSVNKIKVIYNGVTIPEKPRYIPSIFRENDGNIWIGLVASLTPVKRHDLLIKAYAIIKTAIPKSKIQFLFLGAGKERDKLENLVKRLQAEQNIHFAGAVKDVAAYLYQLDIGVLCSEREGLSNAILEYMACSLPVVATKVGGNTELVDKENGICVPTDDVGSLANALLQLIENENMRKKLGASSLSKIQRSYSWHRSMTELESYYKSLIVS
jgi:glycosyltransferase involved in cell wall biosynthesis